MSKDKALFIFQLIGGSKGGGAKGIPKVPKNYVPKNIKMINILKSKVLMHTN
ncbi:hypothetical protein P4S95_23635 [Aneurinibacillus aneurinilyticus]|uniref:hypothetical protein n=1 Tax=Aneurinibacillus aneurinilyticus TaxID=1391 RepID=UPI002E1D8D8C|nr:hypothetical protein [Aneurinibacillus aneurinilyticus]